MPLSDFEVVMGLEVHAQLLTHSKIFCGCSTAFGGEPSGTHRSLVEDQAEPLGGTSNRSLPCHAVEKA